MPYRPIDIERFGGLDLYSAPDQAKGAIDMLNIDLTRDGLLRVRDGCTVFTTTDAGTLAAHQIDSMFSFLTVNNAYMIIAYDDSTNGLFYNSVNASGVLGTAFNAATLPQNNAKVTGTVFGTGTAESFYGTCGFTGAGTSRMAKFTGTVWSNPTASVKLSGESTFTAGRTMPQPYIVTVSPIDNRLVAAGSLNPTGGPGGSVSNVEYVHFSEPGDAEKWDANNFVRLMPNDGERIQAAVVWRDLLFIFKASRYFVFYGTSTDSSGNPIFNYRTVDVNIGPVNTGSLGQVFVTVGTDGVYFVTRRGVYRTTGGAPQYLSQAVAPLFQGGATAFWQGGRFAPAALTNSIAWFNERLYISMDTDAAAVTANAMLVYDPKLDWWAWWTVGDEIRAMVPHRTSLTGDESLYFSRDRRVRQFVSTATDDAGTAIVSRYRAGFNPLGSPVEKTVRETILDGSGSPTLQWSRDWGSLGTGSAVTLGTSPATAVGRQRQAIRGRLFSWQIGASSGAWVLQRLRANVHSDRPASVTV